MAYDITPDIVQSVYKDIKRYTEFCKSAAETEGMYEIGELDEDAVDRIKAILTSEEVELIFPGDGHSETVSLQQFATLCEECVSSKAGKDTSLRTQHLAFQLVSPVSEMASAIEYQGTELGVTTPDRIRVRLARRSTIVASYAVSIGAYHDDYFCPLDKYLAIEVDFFEFQGVRTEKLETQIVDSFLFELASSHKAVFEKSEFVTNFIEEPEWINKDTNLRLRPLEGLNEGIRLYLAAAQVSDVELRLFSFFKVLEYFAPTVLSLEVHELIRKKLDSPEALAPTGEFIREILQTAKSYDTRKNDRDLIKGILLTSVDLIGLDKYAPGSMRRSLTHESPKKDIEQYARDLAECICSTRNQVAHAKSTFESRGTECPAHELPQLTEYVELAAGEVIRWYNRLPNHQKASIDS